ncbi:hypothetical protein R3P38DRAFT_3476671 [Favolaschia claudopus]|uniref:Proteophosphoglycan ppg4 n=1 Tax=Favolaschia claudopus TaxID=2862362 RepID=A0AAV9ZAL0_9AGAR
MKRLAERSLRGRLWVKGKGKRLELGFCEEDVEPRAGCGDEVVGEAEVEEERRVRASGDSEVRRSGRKIRGLSQTVDDALVLSHSSLGLAPYHQLEETGDLSATAYARPSSSSSTNALKTRLPPPRTRQPFEESQSLPSPVTSHEETGYPDKEEGAEDDGEGDEDEKAAPGALDTDAHLSGYFQDEAAGEMDDDEHGPPRPWYKPSLPIVFALAPPIGNWITGGDHLKDLVLLLLLIFYLHQLIEVPWSLYRSARPRRSPTSSSTLSTPSPASALHIAAAKSQLRSLELLLLTLCVLTPVLGVLLLRSLASFTSSSPTPNAAATTTTTTPISWFSTTLFGLITAIRPLRELVSRISTRTSTLHDQIHNTSSASSRREQRHSSATKDEVAALRAQLARLEQALADLTARDEALYAYVEDAVAPLEKGVRRVERRVGKLKNNVKKQREEVIVLNHSSTGAGKGKGKGRSGMTNTIFVPAAGAVGTGGGGGGIGQGAQEAARAIIRSWFGSGEEAASAPPLSPLQTNGFGGAGNGNANGGKGRRAMLDSIPEEGEGGVFARSSSASYPASSSSSIPYASTSAANPSPPSYYAAARHPFHPHPQQHPHLHSTQQHPYQYNQYAPRHPAPLVRRLLAAAFLWPVWVVLAPARHLTHSGTHITLIEELLLTRIVSRFLSAAYSLEFHGRLIWSPTCAPTFSSWTSGLWPISKLECKLPSSVEKVRFGNRSERQTKLNQTRVPSRRSGSAKQAEPERKVQFCIQRKHVVFGHVRTPNAKTVKIDHSDWVPEHQRRSQAAHGSRFSQRHVNLIKIWDLPAWKMMRFSGWPNTKPRSGSVFGAKALNLNRTELSQH